MRFWWLLFLCAASAWAGSTQTIPTQDRSGIQIKVGQLFDEQPRSGYAPLKITITNDTPSTHSWDFTFQSPGNSYGARGNTVTLQQSFSVPGNGERVFEVLVPLAIIGPSQYVNSSLSVQSEGYGVSASSIQLATKGGGRGYSGPAVGYSLEIDRQSGSEIREKLEKGSVTFNASIDFARLPADWRALSGFDKIWITGNEWTALPPATRLAVEQWVATGGVLHVFTTAAAPSTERRGFGEIKTVELAGAFQIAMEVERNKASISTQLSDGYRSNWPNKTLVPPYRPNSILLIGIIAVFGIVVGPVNFFIFARREKRHRIFWTTPLLSIGGALLVGLTILVQDGFAGWGRRLALIHLLPEQNSEVVLQEQASRTGLLTGSGFEFDRTALIEPITLDNLPQAAVFDGTHISGNWFSSRRIQGQWIAAVRPSRAKVQIVNASEVAQGQPPKILSSIGATLDNFFWVDATTNRVWHGTGIGPGQTVTLSPVDSAAMESQLNLSLKGLPGPRLEAMRRQITMQPNSFYATARAPKDALISTLSSIQWRDDRVLYTGPVSP
ncbi:MAG: hypothetical protein ABIT76_12690 [Chthoniobacterales bacterium]